MCDSIKYNVRDFISACQVYRRIMSVGGGLIWIRGENFCQDVVGDQKMNCSSNGSEKDAEKLHSTSDLVKKDTVIYRIMPCMRNIDERTESCTLHCPYTI